MKNLFTRRFPLLVLALLIALASSGIAYALTVNELPPAWLSTFHRSFDLWVVTTESEFNDGVLNNVDTSSSPGDVKLAKTSNWYNTDWQYRRVITIDHTKVSDVADPSTTYANFPVLVYAAGLSNIKADGADICFTASDGTTELPREIESYSGGTLYAWVKVTLTKDAGDSSDDVIYMYYGNTAATEPAPDSTYGSENVWDSNYKGVWHLKEDPDPTPDFDIGGGAEGSPSVTPTDDSFDLAYFDQNNTATATGTLKTVKVNIDTVGNGDLRLMTCSRSGNTFTVRDFEQVTVAGTGIQTFSVNLDVVVGDYIGFWHDDYTVRVERESVGSSQYLYAVDSNPPSGGREYSATQGGSSLRLMIEGSSNIVELVIDSTSNDNDGIPHNMASDDQVTGKADGSLDFDGSNDYIQTTSNELQTAAAITISVWFKADVTTGAHHIVWEGKGTENGWGAGANGYHEMHINVGAYNQDNILGCFYGTNEDAAPPNVIRIDTAFSDTANLHHAVFVVTNPGSSPVGELFLDGVSKGTDTGDQTSRADWDTSLRIGRTGADQRYFDGMVDEVRISNTARSAEWIGTSYNNQDSPSTFCSVGGEEGFYVSPGTIASKVYDTSEVNAGWDVLGWDETLPSGTDITFEVRASDAIFLKGDATPAWQDASVLPSGRYQQWRATLTTTDSANTPVLHEVWVLYSW